LLLLLLLLQAVMTWRLPPAWLASAWPAALPACLRWSCQQAGAWAHLSLQGKRRRQQQQQQQEQ
jgi:hypothetical protein